LDTAVAEAVVAQDALQACVRHAHAEMAASIASPGAPARCSGSGRGRGDDAGDLPGDSLAEALLSSNLALEAALREHTRMSGLLNQADRGAQASRDFRAELSQVEARRGVERSAFEREIAALRSELAEAQAARSAGASGDEGAQSPARRNVDSWIDECLTGRADEVGAEPPVECDGGGGAAEALPAPAPTGLPATEEEEAEEAQPPSPCLASSPPLSPEALPATAAEEVQLDSPRLASPRPAEHNGLPAAEVQQPSLSRQLAEELRQRLRALQAELEGRELHRELAGMQAEWAAAARGLDAELAGLRGSVWTLQGRGVAQH